MHIKTALGIKGSLMEACFPPISPHYTDIPQHDFHRLCNLVHIVSLGIYCSVLEWGRGLVGWGGLISNLTLSVCDLQLRHEKRGIRVINIYIYFIFHQFHTNLLDMPHRIWRKI